MVGGARQRQLTERAPIEELHGVSAACFAQLPRGIRGVLDGGEDDEGRGLVLVVGHRVVSGARHEPEGPLRADEEVLDNLERLIEICRRPPRDGDTQDAEQSEKWGWRHLGRDGEGKLALREVLGVLKEPRLR